MALRNKALKPSREVFVEQLDLLLDRSLKTRDGLAAFASQVAAERAARRSSLQRWLFAKQVTLASVLVIAFLQYYMMGVCVEIMSLKPVVFLQAPALQKPALQTFRTVG